MIKVRKRFALAISGAVGAVLLIASVAYACTYFQGKIIVSSALDGSAATALGNGEDMDWCNKAYPAATATDAAKSSAWTNLTTSASVAITVMTTYDITPPMPCTGSPHDPLSAGSYTVKVKAGYLEPGDTSFGHNCHATPGGTVLDSSFSVDANGEGLSTYNIGTAASAGWNSLCVFSNSDEQANAVNFYSL